MTLSRKLSDALNEQILAEMWSSNLYLSMSIHLPSWVWTVAHTG